MMHGHTYIKLDRWLNRSQGLSRHCGGEGYVLILGESNPDIYVVLLRGELSYLAPLGSEKISAPYFKQCFFRGGDITPQTESNTTPPSPKTEITNILFYILNLWLRIYCSGLRGCDTREKEIVI